MDYFKPLTDEAKQGIKQNISKWYNKEIEIKDADMGQLAFEKYGEKIKKIIDDCLDRSIHTIEDSSIATVKICDLIDEASIKKNDYDYILSELEVISKKIDKIKKDNEYFLVN